LILLLFSRCMRFPQLDCLAWLNCCAAAQVGELLSLAQFAAQRLSPGAAGDAQKNKQPGGARRCAASNAAKQQTQQERTCTISPRGCTRSGAPLLVQPATLTAGTHNFTSASCAGPGCGLWQGCSGECGALPSSTSQLLITYLRTHPRPSASCPPPSRWLQLWAACSACACLLCNCGGVQCRACALHSITFMQPCDCVN